MKSVFMGKNVAQWLIKSIEQIVVGVSPKYFYTFREGDLAYTLQRSSNSFDLFLLLTEFKVGRSRRSIIIPIGRANNGWRVFRLELRKILKPEYYVNGGTGQFVAQLHMDRSGVQPFKSFANTVRGHQVQVRGRNQPYRLSTHDKGKWLLGDNKGEKQNLLSKTAVSLPGSATLERDHVLGSSSVSRVHKHEVGLEQDGSHVGLLMIPFPEPIGPSRLGLKEGVSPSVGDLRLLNKEAYALVMSKAPHPASDAPNVKGADVFLVEESPTPPVMAGTARQHASKSVMSLVGQSVINFCLAKATVVNRGPFSDGFHAGDSLATLDRVDLALFHTTRTNTMSVPPTELMSRPLTTRNRYSHIGEVNPVFGLKRCNFPAIFNFGDSNSDTGGLSASLITITPPYGETYFHKPAGRASDGRLMIDFMAKSLGLPYLSAYLDSLGTNFSHGANFATSASTIRLPTKIIPAGGFSPFYLDIQYSQQFVQFKSRSQMIRKKGGIFATLMPKGDYFSKALYTFDIGQNDLGEGFFGNMTIEEVNASIPDIVNKFSINVKNIYNLGARSFWIHNTGPIGCLPYILANFPSAQRDSYGCAKSYNDVAQYFNHDLKEAIVQLRKDLPLAAITYVDVYSVKYSLFTKPKEYGFELPLVACCGYGGMYNYSSSVGCGGTITVNGSQIFVGSCERPSVRVNWDGIHYTEAANKFVFDQISTGAFSDPPIPLKMACHNN
nr:esterase [Quercus suber]